MCPKTMLGRASNSGRWYPNSTKKIRHVKRRGSDPRGLYAILGVSPNATHSEIVSAGRRKMLETHPDHGGDVSEFMAAREAFTTLRDEKKRAGYDVEDVTPRFVRNSIQHFNGGGDDLGVLMGVVVREEEGIGSPAWLKEPWSVLTESDEKKALEWLWLVVDVARDFDYEGEIRTGVVASDKTFIRQDDIALIGIGKEPDLAAARLFVLSQKVGYKDD